jgi:hypothetical protein
MFEIIYKNCYKKHDEEKKKIYFAPFDKNNEIKLKNKSDEYELIIDTKNKLLINNKEISNKKKILLRSYKKLRIIFLDYVKDMKFVLKLYYRKKVKVNVNVKNSIVINKDDESVINNDDESEINQNNIDWKQYLEHYEDLKNFGLKTKKEVWNHWINFGFKEGRILLNKNLKVNDNFINIGNNIILHISHNFGGGTDNYINNMIDIIDDHVHYKINIIDNNYVKLNDYLINYNNLFSIFKSKDIKSIFIHHLLYNKNNKLNILFNIIDFIDIINCNKYFIVHDYFLFYPNNPNPKREFIINNLPTPENLDFIKKIFNKVNKVFFQSKNTYNNYLKYIESDNFFIINNVPDIIIYNDRLYPVEKNIYNVAILGHINAIHKGNELAKKIFKLFENDDSYKFYIYGTFDDTKFKNLILLGEYKNENIYELFIKYDIDFFLNISIVEETYSYTTSIALNTGLPIIYNNIGSYNDRLQNYTNCYSFTEDKYYELKNIFSTIIKKTYNNKKKYFLNDKKYNLVSNLPEIKYFIENDDNYDIRYNEYIINIINKIVIFILIKDQENINTLNNFIKNIVNHSFYDKIDYIFILTEIPIGYLYQNYKVKLLYYSNNIFYSKIISNFSKNIDSDINILFIDIGNILNYDYTFEILINNNIGILKELNNYDVIGLKKNNRYIHWWSSTKLIKKLDVNYDDKYFINNFNDNNIINFLELHNSKNNIIINYNDYINFNLNNYPNIYGIYFICCMGNYLNIVKNQIEKLINSDLYKYSKKIICFVCMFKDDLINLLSQYNKIVIVKTDENLYEKFAINNFKKYLNDDNYYVYYIHSKSVSRNGKNYDDWRFICDYFTIEKWKLNLFLLNYYDCVGINLKFFPKIHYSGNFWWSKSSHICLLADVDNHYLSPEMYICSKKNTNFINLYSSKIRHDVEEYDKKLFINQNDEDLIKNIMNIPEFNFIDKYCLITNEHINFKNFNNYDYFEFYKNEFKLNNKEILYNHFINNGINENRYKCFSNPPKKNIVIITSKIYVSDKKFSYIDKRSIYTSLERLEQVINTINSIKKFIPEYFIILLDNSKFTLEEENLLEQNVDIFLNPKHDSNLKYYTDDCIYKAYGELNQTKILVNCIQYLLKKNILEMTNLFKITGRYIINDDFNYKLYNNNNNIFKLNKNVVDRKYYYTCFYKISNINFQFYLEQINILTEEVKNTSKYDNIDYEVFFPPKLNEMKLIDILGITQNIGVWNEHKKI